MYVCIFVRPSSLRIWSLSLLVGFTDPYLIRHILKAYDESYSKIIRRHKYKDTDNDKDKDKDNDNEKDNNKDKHTDKVPETPMLYF